MTTRYSTTCVLPTLLQSRALPTELYAAMCMTTRVTYNKNNIIITRYNLH